MIAVAALYYVAAWPWLLIHHVALSNGSTESAAKVRGWIAEGIYVALIVGVLVAVWIASTTEPVERTNDDDETST